MEVYVLVTKKKSLVMQILAGIMLVFVVISVYLTLLLPLFMVLIMIFGALFYLFQFRQFREFEYSYFDGDVRFAKISNKSRRKTLKRFTMEEVVQIAPAGDRSVYKYEADSNVRKYRYDSGYADRIVYDMIFKDGDNVNLIAFEPDERYLQEVRKKYAQKVILFDKSHQQN